MMRRVAITGAGCATPIGNSTEELFAALAAGTPGVRKATLFPADGFPVKIAAEVVDWKMPAIAGATRDWSLTPRQTQFAVAAAMQAWQASGAGDTSFEPGRLGIYLGCGEVFFDLPSHTQLIAAATNQAGEFDRSAFFREFTRDAATRDPQRLEPSQASSIIAAVTGSQGPALNCVAACASTTIAIGEAASIIARGDCDLMISGGAHSMIHPLGVSGFHRLSTLSTRYNDQPHLAMRPFDRNRDGFVIGEAGAVLILEEMQRAKARGAHIYGEVSGFATVQDAYRVTDPHFEGRGAAMCMTAAIQSAGLNATDIDYVNAHGTSTVANDKIETLAIKRALGDHAFSVPVSATKSMVGHSTTAGGGVEALACLLAIGKGVIPPTINQETPDPECDLNYTPNTAREQVCQHVISNSFGFGGQNAVLVFSRV